MNSLPKRDPVYVRQIRQVYWDLGRGWYLRLRRQGTATVPDDVVTIKGPRHGIQRAEVEWQLSGRDDNGEFLTLPMAAELYGAGSSAQVVKTRYGHEIDGLLWDFDQFHFENSGLLIAELEAKDDPAKLEALLVPEWVEREVTDEARFNNENLAFRPICDW